MKRDPLDLGAAVIGLVTVVLANVLYLTGMFEVLDPMTSMDPYYIQLAARPMSTIFAEEPGFGPLYALWLKPFVALLGDPLVVFTANVAALSMGVSALLYLHVLLRTRRAAAGACAALFFLVSDFNVPLPGKVANFALLTILAGLVVSQLVPAGARRLSVIAVSVLLAAYARPELYPAAVALCVAAFWIARSEVQATERRVWLWPAAVLTAIVILAIGVGTPIFSARHGNERLFIAFREHFAWNWSRWRSEGGTFLSIWRKEFGDAESTLQAFAANPHAVARHLADNFLGTIGFVAVSAFDHYPLLAPVTRPALVKAESLLSSAAVFGALIVVSARRDWRRRMVEAHGDTLLAYAAVAACSIGSATLIYPLARYLIFPGTILVMAAALAASVFLPARSLSPGDRGRGPRWRGRLAAALVCLAAVPKPFVLPSAYEVAGSPFKGRIEVARTVTDTVTFIRSLGLPQPVHVLTLTDGIGELLGPGFEEIKVWQKGDQSLETYVNDRHVDLIVTLEAGQQSFRLDDPYWTLILNTPELAGYRRLSVPHHEVPRVYVRGDLLK